MAEYSERLAAAGHDVTILTSRQGSAKTCWREGVRVVYLRSLWRPVMAKAGLIDYHLFPLSTVSSLLWGRFDLIHTFNFTDTLVAAGLRQWTKSPVLLHLNTIPPAVQYRRSLSTGGKLLGAAIKAASELLVISKQQQEYFESRFGRSCVRIPAPVDSLRFPLNKKRNRSERILLCASALDDPRKGGLVLMRAFQEMKKKHEDLKLEICAPLEEAQREKLLSLVDERWHADIHFSCLQRDSDLVAAYSKASALVLPSLWEAFPLVVLEALACGTPVVGSGDGGIPELLESGGAGAVFSPGEPLDGGPSNLNGLMEAIEAVLELGNLEETPERCRAAADRFSWSELEKSYYRLYSRLIEDK